MEDQQQQQPSIKKKIVDFLTNFLKKRPSPDDLRRDNILVAPDNVSPAIQAPRYDLENHLSPNARKNTVVINEPQSTSNNKEHSRNHSRGHSKSHSRGHSRGDSRGGSMKDGSTSSRKETLKNAWDYLRNLDFTFSKSKYGNTVVHRLKHPQFGLSPEELQTLYPLQPQGIPLVLSKAFEYLLKHLDSEGLFRVPGSNKEVSLLKFRIEDGEVDFSDVLIPYNICGLISTFFKELPEPLIPYDYYNEAIEIPKLGTKDKYIVGLRTLVLSLPPANLCLLKKLLEFLLQVDKKSEVNKMTIANLSIIFGATLLKDPDTLYSVDPMKSFNNIQAQSTVIKYLLECFNEVFRDDSVAKAYRKSIVPREPIDTTTIDYLDPASSEGSPRVSIQHTLTSTSPLKPRPPSRPLQKRGTILLSPRVSGGNNQVYAISTLTRPMSRQLFDPEISPSPLPSPSQQQPPQRQLPQPKGSTLPYGKTAPPKPPFRKPQANPQYSTFPAPRNPNTIPLAPIPPKPANSSYQAFRKPTAQPQIPPRKPTSPSPPISNLNNNNKTNINPIITPTPNATLNSNSNFKSKPPPPKRTFTNYTVVEVEDPMTTPTPTTSTTPIPPTIGFLNNSKSQPNLGNLLSQSGGFDRPPNKPPPQPVELASKAKPTPSVKKGVTFSDQATVSNSPPKSSISQPAKSISPLLQSTTNSSIVNKPPSKSAPPPVRTISSPNIVVNKFVPTLKSTTVIPNPNTSTAAIANQTKDDCSISPTNAGSSSAPNTPKSRSALNLSTPKDSTIKPSKLPNSDISISSNSGFGSLPSTPPPSSPKVSSPSVLTVSQKIALNEKLLANNNNSNNTKPFFSPETKK
ncbi:hypothetical protein DICPUDRAFT_89900 [Dictyostelium purpureum]|uniref:Rho-GAP domain-containing protein n=1 Tax=Dictyostelium purpureum TaxID=5786 RepID=F0ZYY8_DICPU|nr:uncharacterized protein DICPUDRAFT_89900 [Dictyostelium purpureum]EGC30840.1 hypothetical protein DICPUDRAFT_89900 [Dictyostelium purpureum]|eukprot:XP_003292629.1 hypothetical protein DICPUDRAFT_89900 [Dictyostelium purpureum]